MTKKLLSLLVAFALLAMPCLTLAEEYQTYVSEDKSVTFLYPSDWILLSRENIDTIIDAAATVEEVAELAQTAGRRSNSWASSSSWTPPAPTISTSSTRTPGWR